MTELLYAVEMLADIIIEKEDAFGMTFGQLEFEARDKCGNTIAYCRNRNADPEYKSGLKQLTIEEASNSILAMREYFKDKLNIRDEE